MIVAIFPAVKYRNVDRIMVDPVMEIDIVSCILTMVDELMRATGNIIVRMDGRSFDPVETVKLDLSYQVKVRFIK